MREGCSSSQVGVCGRLPCGAMCFFVLPACIRMCSVGLHLIAGEKRTKGAGRAGRGVERCCKWSRCLVLLLCRGSPEARREPPR